MSKKIVLGFASILPLTVPLVSVLGMLMLIFSGQIETLGPVALIPFVAINVLMGFVGLAVQIYYCVHIFKSGRVPSAARLPWLLVMIFVSGLPLPIYWYLYIVKPPTSTALT